MKIILLILSICFLTYLWIISTEIYQYITWIYTGMIGSAMFYIHSKWVNDFIDSLQRDSPSWYYVENDIWYF